MATPGKVLFSYVPGETADDVMTHFTPEKGVLLENMSAVSGTQKPGYSPVFRNDRSKEGLISTYHPEITTGYDIFLNARARDPQARYLGYKTSATLAYSYLSYQEVHDMSLKLGSALYYFAHKYATPENEKIISFFLPNFHQFIVADIATQAYSLVNTCLYDTMGDLTASYILKLTESPVIITTKSKVSNLLALKKTDSIDTLKVVITIDLLNLTEDHDLFLEAQNSNMLILDWDTALQIGSKNRIQVIPPHMDDIYTISFTSGTTSTPKGAVVVHRNVTSFYVNNIHVFAHAEKFADKTSFVFLPLAHVFARLIIGYEQGMGYVPHFPYNPYNPITYFEDIKQTKPYFLCLVPRVLTRVEGALKQKLNASKYLSGIIESRIQCLKKGQQYPSHFIYDRIVRPKIRAAIGFENLHFICCGGAPVSKETLYYIWATLGLYVVQGYGSTESCAGFSLSSINPVQIGTNGAVGPAAEVRFKDVPEMEYSFEKNRSGEVLFRGNSLVVGYYKEEAKFKELMDEDGWFQSGDIGRLDENNNIMVIDRVKNFFKLSQGKYVASEKIENTYSASNLIIEQIFVYGDSLQSFLVAIVGVNIPSLQQLCQKLGILASVDFANLISITLDPKFNRNSPEIVEFKTLINKTDIRKQILTLLNKNISHHFNSYEYIKNIHLDIMPFSVEADTLTPTLKVKRHNAKKQFAKEIDQLYAEGPIWNNVKL